MTFGLAASAFLTIVSLTAGLCDAASYTGSLAEAGIVWISDDSRPAAMPESEMRNAGKSFIPDLLVITAGTAVRFPNDDPFFHSIYSEGGSDPFDIGFYDAGPGKVVPFAIPGVNLVRCHIHGNMHATIIVVDGPWAQTHVANERYTLANVRAGRHMLHMWSPQSGEKALFVKV